TGERSLRIHLEGHGREELFADVDLSRTVGWFTSLFPVRLELEEGGPGEALKGVKEQLRAVPQRGSGYGVLRHLSDDPEVREALGGAAEPQVSFNYLGQLDRTLSAGRLFRSAAERAGPSAGTGGRREHLLEINARVSGGRLQVGWSYGEGVHARETVERLAEGYVEALRALIAHCTAPGAGGVTPSDFPLARVSRTQLDRLAEHGGVEDLYPLSPLQQGMLFQSVDGGEAPPYVVQIAYTLHGELDAGALRRAWETVVARHPVLRTAFVWEDAEEPLQVVRGAVRPGWVEEDWRGLAPEEQAARRSRYMEADRRRGFDLSEAPLLRFALFRTGAREHRFVWTVHHLLFDGWSRPLLAREVSACYAALSAGSEPRLPSPRPYRDYVAWVRERDLAAAESFWRETLRGFATPTALEVDAGEEGEPGGAGERVHLPRDVTAALERLARERGLTLNTLVQGAWALLLSRYSGEEDVLFGAVVSGRPAELEGVEEMVGLFINTLPVRVRVPNGASVGEWLEGLQELQAEARQYDYAPLAKVQGWSEVPNGTPLFETLVVFENYPVGSGPAGASGAALEIRDAASVEGSAYPLTLVAVPGDRLLLGVEHDARRFTAPAARRIVAHLGTLLAGMAARPEERIGALPLLPAGEAARIASFGAAGRSFPATGTLHGRFAARAERSPDAVAVVSGEERLTYAELDRRADRLARHLRALGVGPEVRVALCLERGPEMLVSLLAVLRAGGAYVPLDPAYPPERLRFLLEDSGARVLLAREAFLPGLSPFSGATLCPERDRLSVAAHADTALPETAGPQNLAYVIYTSGSTGTPKGVEVTHANVVRLFRATEGWFGFGAEDVWTLFHSYAVDFSVWEIWGALLYGGRLVVVPREDSRDPEAFRRLLVSEGVTVLNQT
ncbi:MAG TPA: condensation domain-containing protein, partial [Longimicrobiaceae bacterium]|nr:condensation domain-containing protein [Longimicrobiaceae bacterium]